MFLPRTYHLRRASLKKKVDSGIIFIPGNEEASANYPDNTYRFRQDSTFLYFFGINKPGLCAIIDVDSDAEIIFGNDSNMDDIIWMGPQQSLSEQAEQVGIHNTLPMKNLATYLSNPMNRKRRIHFLPQYRYRNMQLIEELLGIRAALVNKMTSVMLINAVVNVRSIKRQEEIDEIETACAIGYEMHTAAMRLCRPGISEQSIVGVMEGIVASFGCTTSFPTILTQNGETLHNHDHSRTLTDGRLLLIDAGAESLSNYCSDHTRTLPVSGKFANKQKEIYQIVYNCQKKTMQLVRPNITYQQIHLEVCKVLAQGLKDLGLMKGCVDEAVAAGAHALFMPHGLGHMMGMDVHDMENLGQIYVGYDITRPIDQFGISSLRMGRELKEGFVITNEPGCYFIPALIDKWKSEKQHTEFLCYDEIEKYKDFGGIRLENDLLVTTGCQLLGKKQIPMKIEEVEKYIEENSEM